MIGSPCTDDACCESRLELARLWLNARRSLADAQARISKLEDDREWAARMIDRLSSVVVRLKDRLHRRGAHA